MVYKTSVFCSRICQDGKQTNMQSQDVQHNTPADRSQNYRKEADMGF